MEYKNITSEQNIKKKQEELERNTEYQRKETEASVDYQNHLVDEQFKGTKHDAEVHKKTIECEKKKKVARIDKQENSLELDLKLGKKRMEFKAETASFENEIAIEKESDNLAL